jgi:hypothetical protein
MSADHALLRVAAPILERLEAEGSGPLHVLSVMRHDDGTLDLVLGSPTADELRTALDRLEGSA